MAEKGFFDEEYYENGVKSGKSNYENCKYSNMVRGIESNVGTILQLVPNIFKPETSVLDVGCAKNFFLKYLKRSGLIKTGNLCGMEISDYAFKNAIGGISILHGSISGPLPFDTDQFDVVTAFDSLEHVPFPKTLDAISNVVKVAKNHIILTMPVWFDDTTPDQSSFSTDKSHVAIYTTEWWIENITKSGKFKLVAMVHMQNNVLMILESRELYKERFLKGILID